VFLVHINSILFNIFYFFKCKNNVIYYRYPNTLIQRRVLTLLAYHQTHCMKYTDIKYTCIISSEIIL